MTRILIVEDEVLIAEDLAATCKMLGYDMLEPAFSPGDAINKLENDTIDLVILDINLESSINGIEIAEYINERLQIPFIYLTSYSDKETITSASKTKPMAYITKPFRKPDIVASIEIALQNFKRIKEDGIPPYNKLKELLTANITQSEYKLLKAINEGKSNAQLSELFNISHNTVKTHLRNVYLKLGVNSRVSAISKIRNVR